MAENAAHVEENATTASSRERGERKGAMEFAMRTEVEL